MLPSVLRVMRVKFPRFASRWARAIRRLRPEVWEAYGDGTPAEADALLEGEVDDDEEQITDAELYC
jgi:hypothetical protein